MILDEIVEKRKINIAKQKQIKSLAMLKKKQKLCSKIEIFLWKKH